MKIHNEFDVPLPPAEAWTTLRDIEEIVHCLPGAEITEKVDELVYRGHIAVKLGPVALRFRGTVQYTDINDADRRASIQAQARDDKGRGGMHVLMDFNLEPVEDGSRVFVDTDLKLNGNIAQYGRAAGIVEQLAEAKKNDTPGIHQETLLAKAESESKRLRDIFRSGGKLHPAFGTLIGPVAGRKGVYELKAPIG